MPEKLDAASNFANKLWNASKFVLSNIKSIEEKENKDWISYLTQEEIPQNLCKEDKWILSKLNRICKEVTENIENYELGVAAQKIYDFIWNEFCDWYIEIVKTRLYDESNNAKDVAIWTLNKVLKDSLKLLHPIMPFVTEKIYMQLYHKDETIMKSSWPVYEKSFVFENEEMQIEQLKEIIIGIRNVRTNRNVPVSKKTKLIFVTISQEMQETLKQSEGFLKKLGYANEILVQKEQTQIPQNAISILTKDIKLFIPFEDLVDLQEEKKRLQDEEKRLESEVQRASKMLQNPGFVSKAPVAKIEEEKQKLAKYEEMLSATKQRLQELR